MAAIRRPCSQIMANLKMLVKFCEVQNTDLEGYNEILRRVVEFRRAIDWVEDHLKYCIEIELNKPPAITEEDLNKMTEEFKKMTEGLIKMEEELKKL